jgi:predicted metal-binding membrane protein
VGVVAAGLQLLGSHTKRWPPLFTIFVAIVLGVAILTAGLYFIVKRRQLSGSRGPSSLADIRDVGLRELAAELIRENKELEEFTFAGSPDEVQT